MRDAYGRAEVPFSRFGAAKTLWPPFKLRKSAISTTKVGTYEAYFSIVLLIPELCPGGQRLTCGPTLSTNQMRPWD